MRRLLVIFAVVACMLHVPGVFWPGAFLYTDASASHAIKLIGFFAMLGPLVTGAVYAIGAARRLEPGNRARPAWTLLSGWLACFALGEALLGVYPHVLGVALPVPSPGDGFFLAGYALLVLGLVSFVRVYMTSGLPLGRPLEPLLIGLVAAVVFAVIGFRVLSPVANTHHAAGESLVTLAYPVLDFVVLVPTTVLVRLTFRFQGGRVWRVWGSILAGFVSLAAADILFAYFDLAGMSWLDPLETVGFIAGYTLAALGAARQYALLGE